MSLDTETKSYAIDIPTVELCAQIVRNGEWCRLWGPDFISVFEKLTEAEIDKLDQVLRDFAAEALLGIVKS